MPTFTDQASPEMRERATGLKAPPLPRISPLPSSNASRFKDGAQYEVIVIGTGPAGMFFSYLLAYYGLGSGSVLPLEKSNNEIIPGQADGLQPRTLEVLRSHGLVDEILSQGFHGYRVAFWNPGKEKRIERTAIVDDVIVPSRYKHKIALAAGRVVNIIERAMNRYDNAVERGIVFEEFELIPEGEYPVKVTVRDTVSNKTSTLFTKYLVGADGAHSAVREGMGSRLEGETTDSIWGVVDAILKTDFPDIRKRSAIHSPDGSIMSVPRELIEGHQNMTRIYTQLENEVDATSAGGGSEEERRRVKERRAKVTLPRILEQVKKIMQPYTIEVSHVDWWAAYQVGQRVAESFALANREGHKKVFIMGDACHTHSPKAGQGMNISMMDAFNLAWKLAHVLNGLAPAQLLDTYETERRAVAQQLIEWDKEWARTFSQKIGAGGLTHNDFINVFYSGGGFTSGCGVQYHSNTFLTSTLSARTLSSITSPRDPDLGHLTIGRRLINVPLKIFSSDAPVQLQDILPSNQGRYTIFSLLPAAFRISPIQQTLSSLLNICKSFAAAEPFVIHPVKNNDEVEWANFPEALRNDWEWRLCGVGDAERESIYQELGLDENNGIVCVVRPDGVVGGIWCWDEAEHAVEEYMDSVMRRKIDFESAKKEY